MICLPGFRFAAPLTANPRCWPWPMLLNRPAKKGSHRSFYKVLRGSERCTIKFSQPNYKMLTEEEVLLTLEDCFHGYCHSITLSHPYVYLIDSRLNIFRDGDDRWAVVTEGLGYDSRADMLSLDLTYFGNCLY